MALIQAIGEVEHAHNGDVILRLGGKEQIFTAPHDKDLAADDVMMLRHLMIGAGWAHGEPPLVGSAPTTPDMVIVIDHAEARIYAAGSEDGASVHELHHLSHSTDRRQHNADRDETYPLDKGYFEAIAKAVSGEGLIVVVGHGHGQSSEADHLMAYLGRHHTAVHARVAHEIVADLPHLTVPQLVELGRHALLPALDSVIASTD